MSSPREAKTCASCGRRIEWRKKWERDWEQVRYCSTACRRRGVGDVDRALERSILDLLAQRAHGATICPSEAARAVAATDGDGTSGDGTGGDETGGDGTSREGEEPWRALMEPARRAARRLVDAGEVEILQQGHVVDPSTAKGPIRVRRLRGGS